jgi:hypothetical protein
MTASAFSNAQYVGLSFCEIVRITQLMEGDVMLLYYAILYYYYY